MRIRIIAISAAAAFLVAGLSACAKKPSDGSSVSKGSASAVESQLFPSVGTESEYRITESEANELFHKNRGLPHQQTVLQMTTTAKHMFIQTAKVKVHQKNCFFKKLLLQAFHHQKRVNGQKAGSELKEKNRRLSLVVSQRLKYNTTQKCKEHFLAFFCFSPLLWLFALRQHFNTFSILLVQ